MSYSVHVFPIELLNKTVSENMGFDAVFDYIEYKENLIPFSEEQLQLLEDHLDYRGYKVDGESANRTDYMHPKYPSVSVIVTSTGAYFSGRSDDIMEITMTAGEFSYLGNLKGKFGVFDPGNDGWQERK